MNETIKQPETVLIFVDILNDRYLQWIDVNTYEFGWTDVLGQASVFQPDQEQSILQAIARIETGEAWIEVKTIHGINIGGAN